ncbi:MAG: rhomboid family intramembrane serine protease [Planctomycetaceae bacterium]
MVTKIMLVTIGVYLIQLLAEPVGGGDSVIFRWLALERSLLFESGQIWRLVTYAFCHSETQPLHITCNMLALFFLGRTVVQTLGRREFLAFYLSAAAVGGMLQVSAMAIRGLPGEDWTIGASGAVCAVFMLFAMYYPRVRLYVFGLIPLQTRWLLAAALVYDGLGLFGLAPGLMDDNGSGIGHAAHLGGFTFGFLYFRMHMNLTGWLERWQRVPQHTTIRQPNLKVFNPGSQPEIDYETRLDEILEKISREGEASLTERERRILNQASEFMRSRR